MTGVTGPRLPIRGGFRAKRWGPFRRLRLVHNDQVFLDRWAIASDKVGGVMLHRLPAPDPGSDLHNHPWPFISLVLWGGYTEQCAPLDDALTTEPPRGRIVVNSVCYGRWRMHRMPLDHAHSIISVEPHTWTLVLRGPRRRDPWEFVTPVGLVPEHEYDYSTRGTVAIGRRVR